MKLSLGNANPIKLGKCFQFLNDWYSLGHGGNRGNQYTVAKEKIFPLANSTDEPTTQTDLATTYGITKQTMSNYMRLAKAIPELEDLVDTGIVTTHIKREYQNGTPFRTLTYTCQSLIIRLEAIKDMWCV